MTTSTPETENLPRRPRVLRRAARADAAVVMAPGGDSVPVAKTFQELYCLRHGLSLEQFETALFRRCLPWRARLLQPFLALFLPHYFSLDRDFIRSVADVRSAAVLMREIKEFRHDSRNLTWARNRMRLRLSTARVLNVAGDLATHLAGSSGMESSGSTAPFSRNQAAVATG